MSFHHDRALPQCGRDQVAPAPSPTTPCVLRGFFVLLYHEKLAKFINCAIISGGESTLKTFLQQVYEVYRPLRFSMLGLFGFIILSQAMNLASPYFWSKIVDGLTGNKNLDQTYFYTFASLALWLFRATIFQWVRDRYELARIDFAIPERMQEVTLTRLFGFSIGQHTSENSGIKQSVINRGENALVNLGDIVLYQAFPLMAEVFILTGVLMYWSRPIGLTILVCVVVYIIYVVLLNRHFRKDFKVMNRKFIDDSKFQGEVIRNIGLVMASAQENRAIKECKGSFTDANQYARNIWDRFVLWAAIRNAIPVITRFAVLAISIKFVVSGRNTIGEFVMFSIWANNAIGNLGEMSPMHRRFIQAYTSVKRYFDMLNIEPDVKVIENPVRPEKFAGRIEFKGVTFRYRGRDAKGQMGDDEEEVEQEPEKIDMSPALDNVSFIIEAGQKVAFVGESGAGKSTLVNAIIRASDPETGQITVDGNDLRVLDLKCFRESIGIVNQDVSLFDQTLRYNITYGLNGRASQISDHELRTIAEMSCVNRFFHRLERGFDTLIGERGVKLSGGERQRVGIARALIKEPDILIFDEATSNLDSENEALIQQSIDQASRGRTTIIIAHRFSTIRSVDKVIVLDKGKVVAEGKHAELILWSETYQRLVRAQVIV